MLLCLFCFVSHGGIGLRLLRSCSLKFPISVASSQFCNMAVNLICVESVVALLGLWARICGCVQFGDQEWTLSLTRSPVYGYIMEGGNITFTCTIHSDNPDYSVWITWQHSLHSNVTTLTEPTYVTGSHNLTLTGLSVNQVGYYRCAGISWSPAYWDPTTFSEWSYIELYYRPLIIDKDRTWIGANNNHTATLKCSARCYPEATVTWYGPTGANITGDTDPNRVSLEVVQYVEKTVSQLTISPVNASTDYGMYRCTAANGIGTFDEHEMKLKETEPPEAPKNLDISNNYVKNDRFGFNWRPGYNGGEKLESYYMNIRKIPGEFNASTWIPRGLQDRYWSYSELQPDTFYQLAVYARNKLGSSPYATLDVRTAPTDAGITVSYTQWNGRLVINGIPNDDDNSTYLLLRGGTGMLDSVSLRPDLDCIQRDGKFEYLGPYSEFMDYCYCRDRRCGWCSNVKYIWISVTKTPSGPVLEGDEVTLACIFNRHETGWMEWRYSLDRDSSIVLTAPTFTNDSTNNLTLEGVSRNQTGWYRCAGTGNWPSSRKWNPTQLSDWTAVAAYFAPEIINKNTTWIGAHDNHAASLECIIRGNPTPNVTWYGPKDTIVDNNTTPGRISLEDTISGDGVIGYHVISRMVFAPVDVSTDYGMYRCRADNGIGAHDDHKIILRETDDVKPTPRPTSSTGVIVAVCVGIVILILIATIAICYYYRCFPCAKTNSHGEIKMTALKQDPY